MVSLPGGTFTMGSGAFYADEGPVHERTVAPFAIDDAPVTNRRFAAFVDATGYVTVAEEELDARLFPQLSNAERAPGSMVFTPTEGPVDLRDWRQWWAWVPGARWREPFGPGSDISDILDHPVVQVAYRDAQAFAAWDGKRLPTEVEWEYAARGGLDGADFTWGDEPDAPDALLANHWQGRFPYLNTGAAGWVGTSPVATFPANGFGLFDMTGNVWEWTDSPYAARHLPPGSRAPDRGDRPDLAAPVTETSPRRVLKGGSHLCSPEYCLRYRPAARSPQSDDTSMTHIGFRCAR
ncbi:formylglycine-generating enzyme family protein [Microbacterium sp. NPDC089189]|uniref:formylglycine-generating enzyme family protein n=1 Tax=Microbacterium sp. NPDC089189 TaxID=3154972 RepID=UPI0034429A0D